MSSLVLLKPRSRCVSPPLLLSLSFLHTHNLFFPPGAIFRPRVCVFASFSLSLCLSCPHARLLRVDAVQVPAHRPAPRHSSGPPRHPTPPTSLPGFLVPTQPAAHVAAPGAWRLSCHLPVLTPPPPPAMHYSIPPSDTWLPR